jgi:hypothetical protein
MWSIETPDEPGRYWFKGLFELVDGQPKDMLEIVTVDEVGMVTLPGIAATFPLKRFIGEWEGPLIPPYGPGPLAKTP